MKNLKFYIPEIIVVGGLVFLMGCPSKPFVPDLNDQTPPVFDIAEIQLISGGASNARIEAKFDIKLNDVTKINIDTILQIRFNITATDNESGIKSIALDSSLSPDLIDMDTQKKLSLNDLRWKCSYGRTSGNPTFFDPIEKHAPLIFSNNTVSSSPIRTFTIFEASPLISSQCTCEVKNNHGSGPVDIAGNFRVLITNGAGLTTTTGFFYFQYADIGLNR